jgi:glutamyl-tRNA synthetase
VRTALYNYLFARRHGGQFLLRIEDTDQGRFVPGAEDYILEALRWLGIEPDFGPHAPDGYAPYRQSERKPMYRQYADQLLENGWAYYAFDTEDDLVAMRQRMEAAGYKSPAYGLATREHMKNSLVLPQDEVQARLESGEPYVIRFKMPRKEEVRFEDAIRGWVVVNSNTLDDKVLLKSDGMPTYHLANIVDDHLMEITHVIRGEEWLPSAPLHVLMYRAFGWTAPTFAHLPLILRPDGNGKLSKRDGDRLGIPVFPLNWTDPETGEHSSGYREAGYLPDALLNFLALLGWNPGGDRELLTRQELTELFGLDRVGKAGTKFDKAKLDWFQQTYFAALPLDDHRAGLKQYLQAESLPLPDDHTLDTLIPLVRERASRYSDLYTQAPFLYSDELSWDPEAIRKRWQPEAPALLEGIATHWESLSETEPAALEAATKAWVEAQGSLAVGKLMPILRYALTAALAGPHLFDIVAFLGTHRSASRLRAGVAALAGL